MVVVAAALALAAVVVTFLALLVRPVLALFGVGYGVYRFLKSR
jgi:hypothetical protein